MSFEECKNIFVLPGDDFQFVPLAPGSHFLVFGLLQEYSKIGSAGRRLHGSVSYFCAMLGSTADTFFAKFLGSAVGTSFASAFGFFVRPHTLSP